MPILSIEIICRKCSKCEYIEAKLRESIRHLEYKYKIKIPCQIKLNENIREMEKYALNASQRPVVLINGNVEFAGRIHVRFMKAKMDSILKGY
jgi:hypothetical protein